MRATVPGGRLGPRWRGPGGRLCCASARKLLPKLAASLGVPLPEPEARPEGAQRRAEAGYPDSTLACGLSALGEVSLDPVPDSERRSWESMVENHHPKGWRRPPGWPISAAAARGRRHPGALLGGDQRDWAAARPDRENSGYGCLACFIESLSRRPREF
ncbi:MAG: hypothetical protein OXC26_01055 [Albidovulum sp.]|nr:hypothetical protein [Albidovulum sp.]